MSKTPPIPGAEFTASDVLAPQFWTGRAERTTPGLDMACTKIAVDFQNITRESAEACIAGGLAILRAAASAEVAFVLFLDAAGTKIETVPNVTGQFVPCHPEELRGRPLAGLAWLAERTEHLKLSEMRDTANPRREQAGDATVFTQLGLGAVLAVAFRIRNRPAGYLALGYALPHPGFDVNFQLLLKLLASSLATGLDRVRTTLQLARLQERNQLTELTANDGVWDFDVDGREVYFSPRWRAMLGYDVADVHGNFDWRSLVHPDDMARVQSAIREHVGGRTPMFESVHRMRHRNGEWRWVVSRAKAQVDAHGRLLRLVGVEHDITERKLYEEALFREKESAQITLQSIGDGVITTDAPSTRRPASRWRTR
jgi:PAS domain S-box-containing protein